MNIDKDDLKEMGLTMGAVVASILLKKILEDGYEKLFKEDPPNAVTDREVHWPKVVGWTIVSGLAATATKVLIKRYGAQELEARDI